MMIARLAVIVGLTLVFATASGCRGMAGPAVTCNEPVSAPLAAAVCAATEHRQTPYATPRLTDRWRQRERLCAVARQAERLLAECNEQCETELAAAPEGQRSRIQQKAERVEAALQQVKAAAEAQDPAAVRCRYREYVSACMQ